MRSESRATESLRTVDTNDLRALMRERFGLELRVGQEAMARARVEKFLRVNGAESYRVFRERLTKDPSGKLLRGLADALTTNHTSMFREHAHFDFVRKILQEQNQQAGSIRVWSAGCATGEEAYSLACCAVDELGLEAAGRRIRILATDLSHAALALAVDGTYPEERFHALPMEWRRRFLLRGPRHLYRFKPEVKALIRFRSLNLIEGKSPGETFSIIFCRNVMIYFDADTRDRVVRMLSNALEPGGYLITGHCEGLAGVKHTLNHVGPAIHQKGHRGKRS
jgi:chemotaxis protein methyltransferase CheR